MNTQVSRKILYFLTVFSVTCFAAYEVWAQALFAMDSNSGPLTIAAQHTLAMTVDTAGGVTTTKPLVIAADATTTCSTAGAIRWNSTTKTHESCNGSQWTSPQYSAGANLGAERLSKVCQRPYDRMGIGADCNNCSEHANHTHRVSFAIYAALFVRFLE